MRDEQMKALHDRLAALQANGRAIRARLAALRRERETQDEQDERAELRSVLVTLQQERAVRQAMQAILGDVAKRGAMTDEHGATCCVATYTPGQGYAHAADCVVARSRAILALVGDGE